MSPLPSLGSRQTRTCGREELKSQLHEGKTSPSQNESSVGAASTVIRCICEGVDGPFTGMFGCLFLLLFWEVMNIYIDIKIESIGLPINLLCILQTCFLVKGLSFHVPCGIF